MTFLQKKQNWKKSKYSFSFPGLLTVPAYVDRLFDHWIKIQVRGLSYMISLLENGWIWDGTLIFLHNYCSAAFSLFNTPLMLKYFHNNLKNMPENQLIAPATQAWESNKNHKGRKTRNDVLLGFNKK